MHESRFISMPRTNLRSARHAVFASLVFHGLAVGSVLGLVVYYRSPLPPIQNGSPSGSTTISLQKMVIVPPSIPPAPPTPVEATPPPTVAAMTPAPETPMGPLAPTQITDTPILPEVGVPVLPAIAPVKTALTKIVKATAPSIDTPVKQPPAKPKTVASITSSSYTPGREDLPHPPYPMEARDLRETGTVVMAVRFDAEGSVAQARISQSSGVPLLDSETRSFIRANWHSSAYANQTVSVPVEYTLQQL